MNDNTQPFQKTDSKTKSIPWVEKYRPNHYQDIILEPVNKKIFSTILKKGTFPNLLLYGPPGTGKTTTIMNLTKLFLQTFYVYGKELIVHLNASDERGIDVIRNQINIFTKTSVLFNKGVKFIILDEADYMTKNAQQSLRTIIHERNPNIKFCIICNYISKIDESLKHEFISVRFNNLPKEPIFQLLERISHKESISYQPEYIENIINLFRSDIRSMINYLQIHQYENQTKIYIKEKDFESIYNKLSVHIENEELIPSCIQMMYQQIQESCYNSRTDENEYFLQFCYWILHTKMKEYTTTESISKCMEIYSFLSYALHAFHVDIHYRVQFVLYNLKRCLNESSVSE